MYSIEGSWLYIHKTLIIPAPIMAPPRVGPPDRGYRLFNYVLGNHIPPPRAGAIFSQLLST
jgi:hypothetical protein